MKRCIAFFCLLLTGPVLARSPSSFVLLDDGSLIRGEVIERPDGAFVRDANDGILLRPDQIRSVYSDPYRRAILDSSPSAAAMESLLYFNAGGRYIWNPDERFSFFKNDTAIRTTKISLLVLTGFAYFETRRANQRLARNDNFLRTADLREKFNVARNRYYALGASTIGLFAFETAFAYRNFGRHIDGTDLRISVEEPISVRDYIEQKQSQPPGTAFQASIQLPVF